MATRRHTRLCAAVASGAGSFWPRGGAVIRSPILTGICGSSRHGLERRYRRPADPLALDVDRRRDDLLRPAARGARDVDRDLVRGAGEERRRSRAAALPSVAVEEDDAHRGGAVRLEPEAN